MDSFTVPGCACYANVCVQLSSRVWVVLCVCACWRCAMQLLRDSSLCSVTNVMWILLYALLGTMIRTRWVVFLHWSTASDTGIRMHIRHTVGRKHTSTFFIFSTLLLRLLLLLWLATRLSRYPFSHSSSASCSCLENFGIHTIHVNVSSNQWAWAKKKEKWFFIDWASDTQCGAIYRLVANNSPKS